MNKQIITRQTLMERFSVSAFAIGIMISPDSLSMIGNFFGKTGYLGFFLVSFSVVIYLTIISKYKQVIIFSSRRFSDKNRLKTNFETIPTVFSFMVKIIAVIFLSTGLLVSSGFVFNEVFLYWFPNFGFAFGLLGILLGLQFLPAKTVTYLQTIFCGISVLGLFVIIIAGILQADQMIHVKPGNIDFSINGMGLNIYFLPLLFFIGFDLSSINKSEHAHPKNNNILVITVISMGLLFILWGYVSIAYVPLEKLTGSHIPHIIAAKNIMGNTGRLIMGAIVISGSSAAVHAIFTTIVNQGFMLIKTDTLPKFITRPQFIILAPALIIAGSMAGGMAGDEALETFIRASLILWLISYVILLISPRTLLGRSAKRYPATSLFKKMINIICLLILGTGVLILTVMDDNPVLILKFLGLGVSISLIPGVLLVIRDHLTKTT